MEARQAEVVVPNSDDFDKQDKRAARGMVLLNTAAPVEAKETIEVVSRITKIQNIPKVEKNDGWPEFRKARK